MDFAIQWAAELDVEAAEKKIAEADEIIAMCQKKLVKWTDLMSVAKHGKEQLVAKHGKELAVLSKLYCRKSLRLAAA